MNLHSLRATLCLTTLAVIFNMLPLATPGFGETLVFQQLPLNSGLAPSVGGAPFPGHDAVSTATLSPGNGTYTGTYEADDFALKASGPIVDVQWWGSYLANLRFDGAQKFAITFYSDFPATPAAGPSHPSQPLSTQIVSLGALTPGSGTYSETSIPSGAAPEQLYQYGAQLSVPFQATANTVYWMSIVALENPQTAAFQWGWHNRDYTIQDTLAPTPPAVTPGESIIGTVPIVPGTQTPVWHFQDDSVTGVATIVPTSGKLGSSSLSGTVPQNYTPFSDGPREIDLLSQDLAFGLYTTPEPSSFALLALGATGLLVARRRRRV